MRKIIIVIISVAILIGAIKIFKVLSTREKKHFANREKVIPIAYVKPISNGNVPLQISATGRITAKNKIKLYSEVQGILIQGNKEFKPGVLYEKGENIVELNSEEFYANLMAQKSSFYNALLTIMPDIRLDYRDSFKEWEMYVKHFDISKSIDNLPEPKSDQEKSFIASKGILTNYYTIKNLEVKFSKFQLKAPFKGILTEAHVNPGSLVSPGQLIGEYINTDVYELEVAINSSQLKFIKIGNRVIVESLEGEKTWNGNVVRINGKVDQNSQTVNIFIELVGRDLREGMYLKAMLESQAIENAMEVPRNLLVNNTHVYIVKDSILYLIQADIVNQSEKTIVLKNLPSNNILLMKPIPKSFNGMRVKPIINLN